MKAKVTSISASAACLLIWYLAALSALVSLFGLLFLLIDGNMGIFMLAAPLFLSPLYGIAGPIASLFPPGGRQLVLFVLCCLVTIPWTLWALRLLEHSED